MNGQTIFDMFLDGAYHEDSKLYHKSFRKGYRKMLNSDVGLAAATRKLRAINRLQAGMVGQFFRTQATPV